LNFGDIRFDLASALSAHRVRFIHGGVDAINTTARKVTVSGNRMTYSIDYDYLLFAVGRRIETNAIPGLSEYSHQLFTIERAEEFKEAIAGI
jgi:NADH dehydrogenase FAD-containing subunit